MRQVIIDISLADDGQWDVNVASKWGGWHQFLGSYPTRAEAKAAAEAEAEAEEWEVVLWSEEEEEEEEDGGRWPHSCKMKTPNFPCCQ